MIVASSDSVDTIRFPNGASASGISLKETMPTGIPMIVMHSRMPANSCPSASHQPKRTIQITFAIVLPVPASCARTTVRPKGQIT